MIEISFETKINTHTLTHMHTLRDRNRKVIAGIAFDWATDKCKCKEELNWKRRTTSE